MDKVKLYMNTQTILIHFVINLFLFVLIVATYADIQNTQMDILCTEYTKCGEIIWGYLWILSISSILFNIIFYYLFTHLRKNKSPQNSLNFFQKYLFNTSILISIFNMFNIIVAYIILLITLIYSNS